MTIFSTTPSSLRPRGRNAHRFGTAIAAAIALGASSLTAAPAAAQNPPAVTPAETLTLSVGRGSMVRLDRPMTDLFVANDAVADVQIRSSTQLYIFGKARGETTLYATDKAGRVVFSANVRVGNNLQSIDDMLRVLRAQSGTTLTRMSGSGATCFALFATVDARDAAVLFRLALESAPAGSVWHAVADEGDRVLDMVEVIGRRLGLPVERVADETFGPFGPIFAMDQPASSEHTRRSLEWEPTHPSLLADLETIAP